tara:strand:+ start:16 stop:1221 length:1206 start_codon:yes stop_codon:yes gene_type:complete
MKSLSRIFVLAVLALFALNCEKVETDLLKIETQTRNFSASSFKSSEIPEIVSSFKKRIESRRNLIYAKEEKQTFWVDEESAIGVRDSIGNMTYTFRMYVYKEQENSLYNLVVNRRVDGNHSPDFVLKYKFIDQDPLDYVQMENRKFNGIIEVFSLESFISSSEISSKVDGILPCANPLQQTSGGGTSTMGAQSMTTYSSGGARVSLASYREVYRNSGSVEVGEGSFGEFGTDGELQKSTDEPYYPDCPKGAMLFAVNTNVGVWHTACRSFEYADFGATGTKVAAVKGIEHPVLRTDTCPGIGYVFPQSTYYFTLPSWKPRAKRESAMALERAFNQLEKYFGDIPCLPNGQANVGLLSSKLLEFTKKEFAKLGGSASIYPPLGWNGEEHEYETNVGLLVPDC